MSIEFLRQIAATPLPTSFSSTKEMDAIGAVASIIPFPRRST